MIPARLGSRRLSRKNLRDFGGIPLIARAIRKCLVARVFDEVWVNSEAEEICAIAGEEGARFHRRPESLANDRATSEDFVREFLEARDCARMVQVHSIAPLLGAARVAEFAKAFEAAPADTMLSYVPERIECAYENEPVNFSFDQKTNSQDLKPVQRIPWSITGWTRSVYLEAAARSETATYAGRIGWFALDRLEGHVIKTDRDLQFGEALLPLAAGDI